MKKFHNVILLVRKTKQCRKNFNGLIILDDIRTSLFEKSNFQFHLAFFAFIFYGGQYLYNCQNDGQSFGLWLTNKTVVHTSKKKVQFLFLFFRRRKINICTIGNTQKIIILFKLRRMIYLCFNSNILYFMF